MNSVITPGKKAAELQQIVVKLQLDPLNADIQSEFKSKTDKLINAQHNERLDLQQRAHVNWLAKGDQGSRFFAQAIKARQARNSIMGTYPRQKWDSNELARGNEGKGCIIPPSTRPPTGSPQSQTLISSSKKGRL